MTAVPGLDPDRLAVAFDRVAGSVRDGRARYAALGIARSSGVVDTAAFGPDGRLPDEPRCSIASITKPITAVAVLQLLEAGLISLGEDLRTWIPDFQPMPPEGVESAPSVSAWHVLTHTSGLADSPFGPGDGPADARTILDFVKHERLRWPPGTAYAYCSDSFYLLSELVDRLGEGYDARLRQRIFEPLGMRATTFDPREPGPPAAPLDAYGLSETAIDGFIGRRMPGGGLWSTTTDVLAFGRALLAGGSLDGRRILGRPFVELMTREHTDGILEPGSPPRRPAYGLGVGLFGRSRELPVGPRAFGHSGASGSLLVVDPDHDLVVVHLRNEWGTTMTLTHEAIAAVYAALD